MNFAASSKQQWRRFAALATPRTPTRQAGVGGRIVQSIRSRPTNRGRPCELFYHVS